MTSMMLHSLRRFGMSRLPLVSFPEVALLTVEERLTEQAEAGWAVPEIEDRTLLALRMLVLAALGTPSS